MQVTKELIENDIKGMEAQLEQLKAQVAQTAGALNVLRNIHEYLNKPEEKVEEKSTSSQEVPEEVHKEQVVDANRKYHDVEGENVNG